MNASRPLPRAYFFRNGIALSSHPCHGRPVLGFGILTGRIGNAVCFESITVRTTINDELMERDFDGPVSVKVWSPDSKPVWFGIASITTVESHREQVA